MITRVLVDAGPLIALFNVNDPQHETCAAQMDGLQPPLVTTWPVLAEAAWLLRKRSDLVQTLMQGGLDGLFSIPEIGLDALPWLIAFIARYQNLQAQLADATLVFLAERENIDTVFTLDRRDFSIYRFGRNRSFRILPE